MNKCQLTFSLELQSASCSYSAQRKNLLMISLEHGDRRAVSNT